MLLGRENFVFIYLLLRGRCIIKSKYLEFDVCSFILHLTYSKDSSKLLRDLILLSFLPLWRHKINDKVSISTWNSRYHIDELKIIRFDHQCFFCNIWILPTKSQMLIYNREPDQTFTNVRIFSYKYYFKLITKTLFVRDNNDICSILT